MKICSRLTRHLMMAILTLILLGATTLAQAAQTTVTWTGAGDGSSYNNAANWSPMVVPSNGAPSGTTYRVVIDGNTGKAANVLSNTSVTIDALVIDKGDSLTINSGIALTVINSGAGTGTIANAGTLNVNEGLLRPNGDLTLSGGGIVNLSDNVNSQILGVSGTERFTNADNTIQGAGNIGQLILTNQGTIIAKGTKPLLINPTRNSTTNVNSGTLRANGGTLNFQFGAFNNGGGTIEALNGSAVEMRGPTINGGTLQTTGTGVIRSVSGDSGLPTLANLTTKGNVEVPLSQTLDLAGTINNSGTIALNQGSLRINGDVTLNGGGAINLANNDTGNPNNTNSIFGPTAVESLTNTDNTIQGAGNIYQLKLVNRGTIVANSAQTLFLNPLSNSTTTNVNSGTLRASGGTLNFQFGTFNNSGGTIEALNGSVVEMRGPTINGGTLQTTGAGVIRSVSGDRGAPTLANLTTKGNVEISNSSFPSFFALVGNIVNSGTIRISSGQLRILGDVTLSGGGTITLDDATTNASSNNNIFGPNATDSLTNADNLIQGAGTIYQLKLINKATIVANGTQTLFINPLNDTSFNTGTLRANGGTLGLQYGAIDNSGGTIEALNGSPVTVIGTSVKGGTLATTGTGVIRILNNGDRGFPTFADLTNKGQIELPGTLLFLDGTITNNGDIALKQGQIRVLNDVTLNGGGTLTLFDRTDSPNSNNAILGPTDKEKLTNVDNTIRGAGSIYQLVFANRGTILANSTQTLAVDATGNNGFTNTGRIEVNAGSTLALGNNDFLMNLTGGTLVGNGTINGNLSNGGTVLPGAPVGTNDSTVGTLTLNGKYTQTADGNLFIQIGGPANTEFDRLLTTGAATFAGKINVKLLGTYAPPRDTPFQVVTYASFSGMMDINVIGRDRRGGFTQKYNPANLTLLAQGIPTIGVNIQPTQVFTNTVLTATVVTAPETPVNAVTYDFQVNGVSKQNGTSNTFDLGVAGNGDKGDVITVIAQTDDDRRNQNSVTIQNSKPVAQDSRGNTARGGQLTSIPLAVSDLDGDPLTFRIIQRPTPNGTASIRKVGDGFVLDYTPASNLNGSDFIGFVAEDGVSNSAFTVVEVAVTSPAANRPATAQGNSASVNAGATIDIPVTVGDPDGDAVTIQRVGGPTNGSGQFMVVNGQNVFRYTSQVRFNGTDTIRFVAQDGKAGGDSPIATINVRVNYTAPSVNQRPVASDSSANVNAGVEVEIPVLIADDGDLKNLFVKSVGGPQFSTVGLFRYTPNGFVFRYKALAGFSGTDTVRFVANDGQFDSNIGTLTINVVASAPSANNASATVNAGQSIDIPVTATSPGGSALIYSVVNNPTRGSGSFVNVGGRTVYRYRSVSPYNGPDSVNFRVTDAQGRQSDVATISIRVLQGNRAPSARNVTLAARNGPIQPGGTAELLGSDPDGDRLTFRIVDRPSHGSATLSTQDGRTFLRYLPAAGYVGNDRATYVAVDASGLESIPAIVSINVSSTNGVASIQAAPNEENETKPSGGSS